MNNTKYRWFKFFFAYKKAFEELNGRRCKKLIIAICEYAEDGTEPNLDKKTMEYFNGFRNIYDADIKFRKELSSKGGKKRWNSPKKPLSTLKNGGKKF